MNSVSPKVALVTGAGTGIGRAASIALATLGFDLVLAGRRRDLLVPVGAQIRQLGRRALEVATDIGQPQSVEKLFARIEAEFGRLDLLFNNAGANARAVPLEELTPEEWQSVFDVNVTGAFLCMRQAFSLMKRQSPRGGRIINNGSVSAITPRPNLAAYTASKHALTGLTKAAALEGRPYDIACGQIDIGNVATAIGAHLSEGTRQADGSMAVEPTIDVMQVAEAIKYMASLPLSANVLSLTVMATKMPLVGRG